MVIHKQGILNPSPPTGDSALEINSPKPELGTIEIYSVTGEDREFHGISNLLFHDECISFDYIYEYEEAMDGVVTIIASEERSATFYYADITGYTIPKDLIDK